MSATDDHGAVGLVETRTAVLTQPGDPMLLAGGESLTHVEVAYQTYGQLNAEASNAVFICHALTGDANAAGQLDELARPGWWDNMIGPGRPIDTNSWFVVCANLLGGCRGTTGPSSIDPATDQVYGLGFPLLDMRDFVETHRRLGRHLGVQRWAALVGGSLGGMQVLQWCLDHPDEVDNAIIIAASSRLTAQNIAFSAVGRQAIMRDPNFHGGQFAAHHTTPRIGLSTARMLGHITYLSEVAFSEKFGRQPQHVEREPGFGVDFAVESYLEHQGEVFLARFDALSYLYLTRVMDYFDPFARPDALQALAASPVTTLVVSFDTDWRFATSHSRRIVRHLEGAGLPVSFREISSPWGHDSFLLDIAPYHATISAFLERAADELAVSR